MVESLNDVTLAVEAFQGRWIINSRADYCLAECVCKKSSRKNYREAEKKLQ